MQTITLGITTRGFDAGNNKTFWYEFKRPILELRPNIENDIDIIVHSVGRKRSDNGIEEGNVTDFSGEGITRMYDQFVCVSAGKSHSSISKPRAHIFDPFTKIVSLISEEEVSATTCINCHQRGLVALSNYGTNKADTAGTSIHYINMLGGSNNTATTRAQASTLRKLYAVTGDDVANDPDTWTLDPATASAPVNLDQYQDEAEWDYPS